MDDSINQSQLGYQIAERWGKVQYELIPRFEGDYDEVVTPKLEKVIHALDWARVEDFIDETSVLKGRPRHDRCALACAFVAKTVLGLATTRGLIERLQVDRCLRRLCGCNGYKVLPSESTFSRAFGEFAQARLADRIHERLIVENLGDQLIGHLSRDGTAIEGNERPKKQAASLPNDQKSISVDTQSMEKKSKKRGRPRKDEKRNTPPDESPIQKQRYQTLEQMMADIPKDCDYGSKCNAQGYKNGWNGYKLHMDTADCGVPISVIISSASMHDSRAALPLSLISAQRVTNCYDVMDAAYCSADIREHCRELGHVPLIDHNPRRGEKQHFDPHYKVRYNERTVAERTNSRLKGEFGANNVMVRGYEKVSSHLMFGVTVLTIDQLIRLRRTFH